MSVGLAADASAARADVASTSDGRFNTQCHPWGNDQSRELCRASFYRLIASPERYDGKLVAVTGYLTSIAGRVVLFPSESSFKASALSEGIEVINYDLPKTISGKLGDGVFPVMVVAVFDATFGSESAWPMLAGRQSLSLIVASSETAEFNGRSATVLATPCPRSK